MSQAFPRFCDFSVILGGRMSCFGLRPIHTPQDASFHFHFTQYTSINVICNTYKPRLSYFLSSGSKYENFCAEKMANFTSFWTLKINSQLFFLFFSIIEPCMSPFGWPQPIRLLILWKKGYVGCLGPQLWHQGIFWWFFGGFGAHNPSPSHRNIHHKWKNKVSFESPDSSEQDETLTSSQGQKVHLKRGLRFVCVTKVRFFTTWGLKG